jgi:hypothetical protein
MQLDLYGAGQIQAGEGDSWHHLEWTETVEEIILNSVHEVWIMVGDNQNSGTAENH